MSCYPSIGTVCYPFLTLSPFEYFSCKSLKFQMDRSSPVETCIEMVLPPSTKLSISIRWCWLCHRRQTQPVSWCGLDVVSTVTVVSHYLCIFTLSVWSIAPLRVSAQWDRNCQALQPCSSSLSRCDERRNPMTWAAEREAVVIVVGTVIWEINGSHCRWISGWDLSHRVTSGCNKRTVMCKDSYSSKLNLTKSRCR